MKLLIGSHNPGKVSEYKKYLADLNLEIVSLADLNIKEDAPENGQTFEENAIKKATFYHNLTGLAVITDDSGLMIDVLNGEPGVKSRRWLGHEMTDEELIETVMEKMKNVPEEKRGCHLIAIITLITADGKTYTQQAQIDGVIAQKPLPQRIPGYPHRSLFYLPQFEKFYLELTPEEHEQVNHRGQALLKMKPILEKLCQVVKI
jgi:XTP/dITP diphosphohydrolase